MNIEQLSRRVRLRDLETLAAVARAGGMRKAAHALNLSQPAVSRAVRDLEETLGMKLLQRGRRGVEPTVFGEALVRRSVAVFDELQGALQELVQLADPTAGEVRLGCVEVLHAGLVPAAIAQLAAEHPRLRFVLESGQSNDLLNHYLRQRQVDFVIARPATLQLPPDIDGEPLFRDELKVAVGLGSPLARKRSVKLADLVDHHWILSRNELAPESPVVRAFAQAKLPMPQRILSSGSLHTRFVLLARGDFVTALPHSLLPFEDYRSRVRILPVQLPAWEPATMVMTLKGRALGPAQQLFLQHLRRMASPLGSSVRRNGQQ